MSDAEERIKQIAAVYEMGRPIEGGYGTRTDHIRRNLEGALDDMERTGKADATCINTLRRAIYQLMRIEIILGI